MVVNVPKFANLTSNKLQYPGGNYVLVDTDFADYVRNAFIDELQRAGVDVNEDWTASDVQINGVLRELHFRAEQFIFTTQMFVESALQVSMIEPRTGRLLFERMYRARTGPTTLLEAGGTVSWVSSKMSEAVSTLVRDITTDKDFVHELKQTATRAKASD